MKKNKEVKIPKLFKEKLLIALRSGLFDQARYLLRNKIKNSEKIGFCCLGVACLVAEIPEESLINITVLRIQNKKTENYHKLPKWFKIDQKVDHLLKMNDAGNSFEEIADYIEKNY